MNKYFVLENENFDSVYLYLCKLDWMDEYIERLKKHGFTDVKSYSFTEINDRMYLNKYHPHVLLIDDSLYPVDMRDIQSDMCNGSIMLPKDIDKKYGFIRCFIPDPMCFWAMANMEADENRERYDELYENGRKMRNAYHSVQEIEDADSINFYAYDVSNPPTEEEKEEDLMLYFEFAICK